MGYAYSLSVCEFSEYIDRFLYAVHIDSTDIQVFSETITYRHI